MADRCYRFSFSDEVNPPIAVSYGTLNSTFTPYSPPNGILTVKLDDVVYVELVGPSGWQLNGNLQLITSRANGANPRQAYSPFGNDTVWFNPQGSMQPDGVTWRGTVSRVVLNPGRNQKARFEITIALNAQLPNSGQQYLADDPEMDVEGV